MRGRGRVTAPADRRLICELEGRGTTGSPNDVWERRKGRAVTAGSPAVVYRGREKGGPWLRLYTPSPQDA